MIRWLVRFLNVCFLTSFEPVDWRSACVVLMYKSKGDTYLYSSFSDLTMLNVVGKVYG